MRVVVDTNVLVSGILNPHGTPGVIVDAILAQLVTVLCDDRILSEYREVLQRPAFGFPSAVVETLLEFLEEVSEHISARPLATVLPDEDDLPFLEVAVEGRADALVTGNIRHFRPRRGLHEVKVVTPADFVHQLRLS
jgi:putative PIN family toxin of toxin-antitoxin system